MKTLRRLLLTTSLAAVAGGVASANSIDFLSTPTSVTGPTEVTYSLSLPKFQAGTNGIAANAQLTGATIYFFVEESISSLTLTSNSSTVENNFTFVSSSNATKGATNTANQADAYGAEILDLFNSPTMSLGPTGTPGCPEATPSAGCNSVAFTPPAITVTNLVGQGPTATGGDGLTGVIENITGGDLANYIGLTTFTLGGATKSGSTFSGGGGNILVSQNTSAEFKAEIDYTYTVPSGTPEPVTSALVGSGLLGLGWLSRRRRQSKKS